MGIEHERLVYPSSAVLFISFFHMHTLMYFTMNMCTYCILTLCVSTFACVCVLMFECLCACLHAKECTHTCMHVCVFVYILPPILSFWDRRIHTELSSVMIRQLPIEAVERPKGWKYAPLQLGEEYSRCLWLSYSKWKDHYGVENTL